MSRKERPRPAGFTLVELIAAMIIVGILAAFAGTNYLRAVEENRAEGARALATQIGRCNQLLFLNTGQYATGAIDNTNILVTNKLVPRRDWAQENYDYQGADSATAPCIVSKAFRKTTGPASTSIPPFNGWAQCLDRTGKLLAFGETSSCGTSCAQGGAPPPPPPP